jgi:voltage-gated potassium channel Kch
MKKDITLVIGNGHLTYRLTKLLQEQNYHVIHSSTDVINNGFEYTSLLDNMSAYMKGVAVESIAMVYLIDENDEKNLQAILAFVSLYPALPITASLFNENLTPHLHSVHNNLTILNPAKIAAPVFVQAISKDSGRAFTVKPVKKVITDKSKSQLSLIHKLLIFFAIIILAAVAFFHFYENLSWVDSLYFVVVTAATVGYGDISLLHSSSISKIFAVILILASTVFVWLIFSLTIDAMLKKRIQLALGRRKYNLKNHVIVCGLGRLGYFIVEELLAKGEKVIIIEQNENSRHIDYFKHLGANVYIGDGRLPKVLTDVNVAAAKALLAVINNDAVNLEIGLNASSDNPSIKVILRIFDEKMAEKIKGHFDIHQTLSASNIADEKFYEVLQT